MFALGNRMGKLGQFDPVFGMTPIQQLMASSNFFAPLNTTIRPVRGSGSPTFTRADATNCATFTDFEGVMRTAIAGEARFQGARRVRNLIAGSSQAMNGGSWTTDANATATNNTTDVLDPLGGNTATKIVSTAATAGVYNSANGGTVFVCQDSWYLRGAVGGEQVKIGDAASTDTITLTTSWVRYSRSLVASVASAFPLVRSANAGTTTWYAWGAQREDVTGQSVQTAGEYVSVGVLSAPYHGAGVDGVKYFDTTLAGASISASTLKGYLSEGSRQNICLQSNALSNVAWTSTLGTLSQNVTGPDGATSAWTLADNSAVATQTLTQNVTLTAATYTVSVLVGKTVGATTYPVLAANTGTVIALATIDTNNGIATAWTAFTGESIAGGLTASCVSFNANFWLVSITFTGTAVAWQIGLVPAATGTSNQSTGTYDATKTGSAVFYGAQVELGSFASTYIPTTTVAVTRNADVLTYPSSGNVLGTSGWCYAEIAGVNIPSGARFIDLGTNRPALYVSATNAWSIYDGVTEAQSPGFTASNTVQKGASTWPSSTNKFRCAANGTLGTEANFDGNMDVGTTISIGCTNAGASQSFGTIRNVRISTQALSAAQLAAITS